MLEPRTEVEVRGPEWLTVHEYMLALQPVGYAGSAYSTLTARFDAAIHMALDSPTGPCWEVIDGLTCPRGSA